MLSLQYKLKKMMIMKKMFSMLFAVVAMAMAFVSCENQTILQFIVGRFLIQQNYLVLPFLIQWISQ